MKQAIKKVDRKGFRSSSEEEDSDEQDEYRSEKSLQQ
jgi:hypothetical protein